MGIPKEDLVWLLRRDRELTQELAEAAADRIEELERDVQWLESEESY